MIARQLDDHILAMANAAAGIRRILSTDGAVLTKVSDGNINNIITQSDTMLDMVVAATGRIETLARVRIVIAEAVFAQRLTEDFDLADASYTGWSATANDAVSRKVFADSDDGETRECSFTVSFLPGSVGVAEVIYHPEPAVEPAVETDFSM
jgi:hypothetical protein